MTTIIEKNELVPDYYNSYENYEVDDNSSSIDGVGYGNEVGVIGDAATTMEEDGNIGISSNNNNTVVQCDSVMRKRRRKMKKHKHRKRLKKTRIQRKRMGKI